jgi:hypothetical protein
MDDAFINDPGDCIPAPITGTRPRARGDAARLSSKRRAEVPRDREPFDTSGSIADLNPEMTSGIGIGIHEIPRTFAEDHIGVACELAMDLLDRRVAAGDTELVAVKCVVERCLSVISAMPPLSHVSSLPLRPDDRFYELFDQCLSLLRQQETQMQELQTMINELI